MANINNCPCYRDMMEIGTVWEDRMKKTESAADGSYVGGWRDGKKNGWGRKKYPRYVKCYCSFNNQHLSNTSQNDNWLTNEINIFIYFIKQQ